MTDYRDWLKSAHNRRLTADEVATQLGISRATATRRLLDGLDADEVIKLCRHLNVNPVEALVDLDHLTNDEAMGYVENASQSIDVMDDGEVALHLARRLNPISRLAEINELEAHRLAKRDQTVHPLSDDEIQAAIDEANQLRGAAHPRTEELTEPDNP